MIHSFAVSHHVLVLVALLVFMGCSDSPSATVEPVSARPQFDVQDPPGGFYLLEDLHDDLAGCCSQASDINDFNQIVGSSWGGKPQRAFFWTAQSVSVDLGTLGGCCSVASAVNNAGTVVGTSNLPNGKRRAFRWSNPPDTLANLGALALHHESEAHDINEAGQIVGLDRPSDDFFQQKAVLWQPNGTIAEIQLLGSCCSVAYAINNNGWVVGSTHIGGGSVGFLWKSGEGMQQILPPWHSRSVATDINDAGDVVGYSWHVFGAESGFLKPAGSSSYYSLPTLGGCCSFAHGVNEAVKLTGSSVTASPGSRTFLYIAFSPMFELQTLGSSAFGGAAINESDDIVGYAYDAGKNEHAVAWWWYSSENSVNCDCAEYPGPGISPPPGGDRGTMYVAIRGGRGFDVRTLDLRTISLGDGEGREALVIRAGHGRDVRSNPPFDARFIDTDGDGVPDLVVGFRRADLRAAGDLRHETTSLLLRGATTDRRRGLQGVVVLSTSGRTDP